MWARLETLVKKLTKMRCCYKRLQRTAYLATATETTSKYVNQHLSEGDPGYVFDMGVRKSLVLGPAPEAGHHGVGSFYGLSDIASVLGMKEKEIRGQHT